MGFLDKMKGLVTPGDEIVEDPGAVDDSSGDDFLEVNFTDPGPDAVTCPIRFDRAVSPGGTSLFETPQEAAAWPAVQALLEGPGVHSVIGKGDILVVARRETATWSDILSQVEPALVRAFRDVRAPQSAEKESVGPRTDEEIALRDRVQAVIDRNINPAVADHGGVITLLDVQGTRVFVHMGGGCQGCAMSTATLKNGVESMLRAEVPEVTEVLDTTDHAAGANPYFSA